MPERKTPGENRKTTLENLPGVLKAMYERTTHWKAFLKLEEYMRKKPVRLTVDSILGDNMRILVAHLDYRKHHPIGNKLGIKYLTPFRTWTKETEVVAPRILVAGLLGVEPKDLHERIVFVQTETRTHEITEKVREESKKTYKPLLSREIMTSMGKGEESR